MLVFVEGGKPESAGRNPWNKDENQQQTQPTYDADRSGNQTRATLAGSECSYHCAISAPQNNREKWWRAQYHKEESQVLESSILRKCIKGVTFTETFTSYLILKKKKKHSHTACVLPEYFNSRQVICTPLDQMPVFASSNFVRN